ncbi:MAG: outer membrane beta-barrel protein [Alphaproteobacteria bacterium]
MKKFLLTISFVGLFVSSANAVELELKPYVGLDYVYSSVDYKYKGMDKIFEENYNSAALNVGAKFHKYFGAEAFYQKSAEEKKNVLGVGQTKAKFQSFGIDAIGYLPITNYEKFEVLGLVGTGKYKYTVKGEIPSYLSVKGSDNGWGLRFGGGLQYNIDEHFAVRALGKYSWLDVDDIDGMFDFSVGLKYSF